MPNEEIPGTEQPKLKKLEKNMERYFEIKNRRMVLTDQEVAARQAVEKDMQEAGIKSYTHNGAKLVAELVVKDPSVNAKVSSIEEDGD